jgi:formate hydrogenlyase subunit 3/multisubunit Na+/H+ antiporter MnhD subunit
MPAIDIPLLAVLLVCAPLSGAVLTFILEAPARWIAGTTALLTLGVALGLIRSLGPTPERYALGGWEAPLGIVLQVDSLSALMVLMTALVGTAATFSIGPRDKGTDEPMFWPLWLGLWSGLNGLFLTGDLFNVYVTLEMIGLAAAALCGLGASREALEAALRYLLISLIGSLCYLMGVALIYRSFGTLDLAMLGTLIEATPATLLAFALMTAGLLLKTALFPLHFWLPPAHANAPAAVSAVLSGLVVKGTFYLVIRLWLEVFGDLTPLGFSQLLGGLGAAAVIWGSMQAIRAERLKMLVAYSTVAQLGYLFLAFALLDLAPGPMMMTAIVLFMVAHAFAKAAMFLAAGTTLTELGHDRIADLAGASRRLGPALFAFGLAGISIVGLPPSGGFTAKWLLLTEAIALGSWLIVAVLIGGSLLAAAYVLRPLASAMRTNDAPPAGDDASPRPKTATWPALALALGSLALGFAAPEIIPLFEGAPETAPPVERAP